VSATRDQSCAALTVNASTGEPPTDESAKSGCVSLRLDDQPASVRRCRPVDVTGVHEVILIEDSAVRRIASTMLLADDTTRRRFD
jgi:hypothetical protein